MRNDDSDPDMPAPDYVAGQSELQLHDPYIIPDALELEHELKRPKWWYAHQLRMAGATWPEVASSLGYSTGRAAQTTVDRMTKERRSESAAEIIQMELERLDMLQLVVWRQARAGSLPHVQMVLNIMTMRGKYIGLDKVVEQTTMVTESSTVVEIGGGEKEYMQGIKDAYGHRRPIEGEIVNDAEEKVV